MGIASNTYTYDGTTDIFPLNFYLGYLNRSDITVRVNDEFQGGVPVFRDFTFIDDNNIRISNLVAGDVVKIVRTVASSALDVNFTLGTNITKENLDRQIKQPLMLIHEVNDEVDEFKTLTAINFEAERSIRETSINSLNNIVTANANNSVIRDNALNTRLDTETQSRISSDASINSRLDNQISANSASNSAVNLRIDNEAATRSAETVALGGRVDSEVVARTAGDAVLSGRVNALQEATVTADAALSDRLVAEAAARTLQIEAANTRIDAEFDGQVDAERTARLAAVAATNARIDSEANARSQALGATNARIDSEVLARTTSALTLGRAIDTLALFSTNVEGLITQEAARGVARQAAINNATLERSNFKLELQTARTGFARADILASLLSDLAAGTASGVISVTRAEFDALTDADVTAGEIYAVTEGDSSVASYVIGATKQRVLLNDGTSVDALSRMIGDLDTLKANQPNVVLLADYFEDGDTDYTAAFSRAMLALESVGGGVLQLGRGRWPIGVSKLLSNIIVRGSDIRGATVIEWPANDADKVTTWFEPSVISSDGTRACVQTGFENITFDGYNRPFDRWLETAEGVAITDPKADYAMGTGVLASGISGVDLTAVISEGAVTGVTINNGGNGFNGHPTQPYQADLVRLWFSGGGGSGARARGRIENGSIVEIVDFHGGSGYTSPPTVVSAGGYADPSILITSEVNRRNPNYVSTGAGISFSKCISPRMKNCQFVGIRGRTLNDAGSLNGLYTDLVFEDCGKNDGPFHAIWCQSFGRPENGDPWFADSENAVFRNIRVIDCERSAFLMAPTKGGIIDGLEVSGSGESGIFSTFRNCINGGTLQIKNSKFKDSVVTDIASDFLEIGGSRNIIVDNCDFEGSALGTLTLTGLRDSRFRNCRFKNNYTGKSSQIDGEFPFGPFSERVDFNRGEVPLCGEEIHVPNGYTARVGGLGDTNADGVLVEDWVIQDTRAEGPLYVFRQARNAGRESKNVTITGVDVTGITRSDFVFLDTRTGNVWADELSFTMRDNPGHASEGPVTQVVELANNTTGITEIDVGFRPSRIEVTAAMKNAGVISNWSGDVIWSRSVTPVNSASGVYMAIGAQSRSQIFDREFARLLGPDSAADILNAEMRGWSETGFNFNVLTNSGGVKVLRLICHP